jgi:hypothetical protein
MVRQTVTLKLPFLRLNAAKATRPLDLHVSRKPLRKLPLAGNRERVCTRAPVPENPFHPLHKGPGFVRTEGEGMPAYGNTNETAWSSAASLTRPV